MEIVLTVMICLLMIAAVILGAAVPALTWFLSRKEEKRSIVLCFTVCLTFFIGVLTCLFLKPVILYAPDCGERMTPEIEQAVREVSRGFYGHSAPAFAVAVSVKETRTDYAAWDIFYFPFGDIAMEYSTEDGYNISRYLVN